jgi:4-amino-4-deoxychorismate lyase
MDRDSNISSKDFQILTSVRGDLMLAKCPENNRFSSFPAHCCKYYLLEYHRDRMLAAAHDFGWDLAAQKFAGPDGLRCLEILLDDHVRGKWSGESIPTIDTPLKLRILLSKAGELTISSAPCEPISPIAAFPLSLSPNLPIDTCSWRIHLWPVPIKRSLFTKHKTTCRAQYNLVRSHLLSHDLGTEILLVNQEGEITEGSITTPYFFRNGHWITPRASCGGNIGTTRRWAIQQGLCIEGVVKIEEVKVGETVWLSNGVRGFGWGVVETGGFGACNES